MPDTSYLIPEHPELVEEPELVEGPEHWDLVIQPKGRLLDLNLEVEPRQLEK
jgi:hypothetical protein